MQAARERRSLLEVSSGIGLAFLVSARSVGSRHVAAPYQEDWEPLLREGFGGYLRRVSGPYGRAVAAHLDTTRPTLTERGLTRLGVGPQNGPSSGPGAGAGRSTPSR